MNILLSTTMIFSSGLGSTPPPDKNHLVNHSIEMKVNIHRGHLFNPNELKDITIHPEIKQDGPQYKSWWSWIPIIGNLIDGATVLKDIKNQEYCQALYDIEAIGTGALVAQIAEATILQQYELVIPMTAAKFIISSGVAGPISFMGQVCNL